MFHFHRKTNIYLFIFQDLHCLQHVDFQQWSQTQMVDGRGVILLGCYVTQDTLYELKNVDGILTWREMPQKLKYPRHSTVAMLIPDDLANCE